MKPMAAQPRRSASSTEPVTALHGWSTLASVSELFSFKIVGMWPANLSAPASRKPSGAAYALQPESIASWKW